MSKGRTFIMTSYTSSDLNPLFICSAFFHDYLTNTPKEYISHQ